MKQVDITDESELEEYSVEIDILSQCRHKNIVGIYEAYYFNSKLCVSILCTHIQPRYHFHNESTVCICVTMKCVTQQSGNQVSTSLGNSGLC